MKLKLLLLICLFSSANSFSQTIEETIDYINMMSKDYFDDSFWINDLTIVVLNNNMFTEDIEFEKKYYNFSVNEKGFLKLSILKDLYIIPAGTFYTEDYKTNMELRVLKKKGVVVFTWACYLKQMNPTTLYSCVFLDSKLYDTHNYNIILTCSAMFCFYSVPDGVNDGSVSSTKIAISVHGSHATYSIDNALNHLIKLAKENPDYWEKDPFE